MFEAGCTYTRREIHDGVDGGSLQSYLPRKGGKVLCGCFNPQLNPDAPNVILAGDGPDIRDSAVVFSKQDWAVPVFTKLATNRGRLPSRRCRMSTCCRRARISRSLSSTI